MPSQDEDGPWEAPLVPNTEALANNPRFMLDPPTALKKQAMAAPVMTKAPKKTVKKAKKSSLAGEL
jgi:hypothetical protein